MPVRRQVGTAAYAGVLFTALGLIAWGTGQPFIFPSLGPTAFVLAFDRHSDRAHLLQIVLAHLIGGVAGLLAWTVVGPGVSITATPAPASAEGLQLTVSATVSIILTTWGMIATGKVHPPACATTLIVSLGLLSTVFRVGIIVASVVTISLFHAGVLYGFERLVGDGYSPGPMEDAR